MQENHRRITRCRLFQYCLLFSRLATDQKDRTVEVQLQGRSYKIHFPWIYILTKTPQTLFDPTISFLVLSRPVISVLLQFTSFIFSQAQQIHNRSYQRSLQVSLCVQYLANLDNCGIGTNVTLSTENIEN